MPLAAALLKAKLVSVPEINDKIKVSVLDFYADSPAEFISEQIMKEQPDFIGFSVYLWNRHLTEHVCQIIKTGYPGIILFAGGAEATALPLKLLESAPFDFSVKGEGELALTEVIIRHLRNETYSDIEGIFPSNDPGNSGKRQWPVMDLDLLPSPFLTGILDVEKYSGVLWELSRGCPFKCGFCFESRGIAGVRQFSLERLQKELELFELKKVTQVFVLDPTFNRDALRAKKILRMIYKTAPLIHFTFEVRTEFIDIEMASLFAKINCSLQIGLQSALPEVLSHVNRTIDPDKYADKISLLNANGVVFGLDLIYGLPGDTLDGFRHSLSFALRLQPNHLDIFPLSVLPGTALYDDAPSFRLNYLKDAPYTLISSPGFSESDMIAAESLKNACDIFYNRGGAAGWMFMVLETLDIDPSDFLQSFSEYIDPVPDKEFSASTITGMQIRFVRDLFDKHLKTDLFPVMKDIITIHSAMNISLYAGPYSGDTGTVINGSSLLKLSPGTVIINLEYNFNDLMAVGELDLEDFLADYRPEQCHVIIYNFRGNVKTLIVDSNISGMILSFKGELALKEILNSNPSISVDEASDFIEYAIAETIIYAV